MARVKRHFLPGHVWHITHRCHKKEFLLKFARDRRRWLQWLFEAKKPVYLEIGKPAFLFVIAFQVLFTIN